MVESVLEDLIAHLRKAQVVIVTADTGRGKTTQLTQRLAYIFHSTGKRIVCTQPRRLASRRVAERVAEEMEVGLGNEVGVQNRELNRTSAQTLLKFVTEGILLRQRQHNASLDEYACIIIDEAHERSVEADILLALLRHTLQKCPDLRLVYF